MPMPNKLPKFLDNHKICIICEGNEEYEYLNRLKNLKVWNEQYDISLVNAGGNGNIPARYHIARSTLLNSLTDLDIHIPHCLRR